MSLTTAEVVGWVVGGGQQKGAQLRVLLIRSQMGDGRPGWRSLAAVGHNRLQETLPRGATNG